MEKKRNNKNQKMLLVQILTLVYFIRPYAFKCGGFALSDIWAFLLLKCGY